MSYAFAFGSQRSMEVDGITSIQREGSTYRPVEGTVSIAQLQQEPDFELPDDEWDARMEARWRAYAATPDGIAVNRHFDQRVYRNHEKG